MKKSIGVIDLGSNTARLVIYEQDDSGMAAEIDNIKYSLRLSNHLRAGRLDEEGVAKTLTAMRQFKKLLDARKVTQAIGVATAAVRQAENGRELTAAIERESGISMRVLSGKEEARYGYLAVLNSMPVDEGITIDIGGGSTEVTYFRDRQLIESHSFPFGIVTLTSQFFREEVPSEEEFAQLRTFLADSLATCPWLADRQCPVIAIGGTARNLGKIHQRQVHYSMDSLHHYPIQADAVTNILNALRKLPLEERRQIPGVSKDRADVILAGMAAFESLLHYAQSDCLLVSNKGLRDGVLYETVWGEQPPASTAIVRERSALQFMNRYQVDQPHSRHVRDLALSLFDQLQEHALHSFSGFERQLLENAALLHDTGRTINVYEASEHTFYLLSNVLMAGYTHRERLLLAMIASYKTNKLAQSQIARHPDLLSKQDKSLVEKLGHLLLFARVLDRSMTQAISAVRLASTSGQFVLTCTGKQPDLLEYSLLDEPLSKLSKAWKIPLKVAVDA
ncbi:exopolyphosphatase [Brevibacillus parabrevis]|uniref:exopolyphosphatase n=1 Tax=Brevibacillus parabrevis TaxID=54914 RepID=UPI0028D6CDA5|nr:exopolyphosphatase [Brevibacillus parabrevis]